MARLTGPATRSQAAAPEAFDAIRDPQPANHPAKRLVEGFATPQIGPQGPGARRIAEKAHGGFAPGAIAESLLVIRVTQPEIEPGDALADEFVHEAKEHLGAHFVGPQLGVVARGFGMKGRSINRPEPEGPGLAVNLKDQDRSSPRRANSESRSR